MAAGDFYIRRNSTDTTAIPNAGGGNEDAGWDTLHKDEGGIVTYTDPNLRLNIGIYLIMYSEQFDTIDTTNNERIEIQGEIHTVAGGVQGGYGQDYIRKNSGDQACSVQGSMILNVTSNNTDVFIRFYRTDDSTTGTVNRVTGFGGVTILELDTAHNFGWYSSSASEATSGTTERTLITNTNDRQDTGFSNSSGVVTITTAGRYLVTYNMDISMTGTSREVVTGYIGKNGTTEIIGTRGYCYLRGIDGTQDGALTWIGIIDVAASDTLQVRWSCPTSVTVTAAAGAKFQLWQIPTSADEFIAEATTGDYNANSDFSWDTNPHIDTTSFTHTIGTAPVTLDQNDHVLAFATFAQPTDSAVQRAVPLISFLNNGSNQSTAVGGGYHRNSTTSNFSCGISGLISNIEVNTEIKVSTISNAASGALANTKGQFSLLSLSSIWTYTFIFPPSINNFNTSNKFYWGDTNLNISGDNFGATQGIGKVEIWDDFSGTTKITQTINSWSDTTISIDVVQSTLSSNTKLYMVVTSNNTSSNTPFIISEGIVDYPTSVLDLSPDHNWPLDNDYLDVAGVLTRNMDNTIIGTHVFTYSICKGSTYSMHFQSVTDLREIADSIYMNITNAHTERTMGGWIRLGGIQQSLGAIYKEGAQINNLCFLIGMGNSLLAQVADTNDDLVQSYSDFKLSPNRDYHIIYRYSYDLPTKEFHLLIDGITQSRSEGNPLLSTNVDAHSGDVGWGDPDGNLEIGGTDVAFAGQLDCKYAQWATWTRYIDTDTIFDDLFLSGAKPEVIISNGTDMQTQLDSYSNSVMSNYPVTFEIERPTGTTQSIELIADNIIFDDLSTVHLNWFGGGTLSWVNINGSTIDESKIFSNVGSVNIITPPVLSITNIENNTEIRIYDTGTTSSIEIAGIENVTTGSFSTYIREDLGVESVDVQIISVNYENLRFENIGMTSGNIELPLDQRFDRNYYNP